MEVDAERTLNNLHVIGALSPYDKLLTNTDTFDIHAPTYMREVYRTWHGEKRTQNMTRIRQTVRSAIAYINKSLEDANALLSSSSRSEEGMILRVDTIVVQHVRMSQGLERSCEGLQNLLQTYRDDATLSSQLSLTMTEVRDFLSIIGPHTEKLRKQCSHAATNSSPTNGSSSPLATPPFTPRILPDPLVLSRSPLVRVPSSPPGVTSATLES